MGVGNSKMFVLERVAGSKFSIVCLPGKQRTMSYLDGSCGTHYLKKKGAVKQKKIKSCTFLCL